MNSSKPSKKYTMLEKVINCMLFASMLSLFTFADKASTLIFYKASSMLFMIFVMIYILKKSRVIITKYLIAYLAFIGYCLLLTIFDSYEKIAIDRIKTIIQVFIFSFAIINYADTKEKIYFILKSVIFGNLFNGIYRIVTGGYVGIIQTIQGVNLTQTDEIFIVGANLVAIMMASSFLISIWLARKTNKKYLIASVFFFVIALFTGSRKAILSIIIGIFVLISSESKKSKFKSMLIIITSLIVIYGLISTLPIFSFAYKRLGYIGGLFVKDYAVDASTQIRALLIREGLNAFYKSPFWGYGLGYIGGELTISLFGYRSYMHSNYIELLVGTGLIGTIIYYTIYFSLIHKSNKIKHFDSLSLLFISILISYTFTDIGMVSYYDKFTHLIFALISANTITTRKDTRNT